MTKTVSYYRIIIFLFLLTSNVGNAQTIPTPPFWNDIQQFKKMDSTLMPPKGKILMIGSSSFTNWKDVGYYFQGYPMINRGFGGSSLPHLIRYFDNIVTPYRARQILIYCGENDLSPNVPADTVVERFKRLYYMIRKQDKKVLITYISMKPSPSRASAKDKMIEGNEKIRNWLGTKKHTSFVDVFNKMLLPDGKPIPDIFLKDSLHMNAKGYTIWQKEIAPHLLKN